MKKILIALVEFYRKHISPYTPASCRYRPTCSQYALDALRIHGSFKGTLMSIARILRCNPFTPGGVDTVPEYFSLKRNPPKEYKE